MARHRGPARDDDDAWSLFRPYLVALAWGVGGGLLLGCLVLLVLGRVAQTPVPTVASPPPAARPSLPPATTSPAPAASTAPPAAASTAPVPAPPPSRPAGTPPPHPQSAARPAVSSNEPQVICIDPGHPSETSAGAVGADGTTERHINWVLAGKLRALLTQRGYKVVLTKSAEKEKVTNRLRAEIANAVGAAALVRLHCDGGAPKESGFAVYYPDQPGTAGGQRGPGEEVCRRSGALARCLDASLRKHLAGRLHAGGVKTDRQTGVGERQGALTGSVFARVPVCTVEMLYISNLNDLHWIEEPPNQDRMALALADGVTAFVGAPRGR